MGNLRLKRLWFTALRRMFLKGKHGRKRDD
jgi:hypothetical protein